MADNETIADIIAEMRRTKYYGEECTVKWCLTEWADRLEAAHRRELAERGDAAKLREALDEILSYIESFHKYITPDKGKELTALFAVADTIRDKARTALSAPPRNCDRFANIDEARKAHEAICEKYGKCHNGCPLNNEEHYSAFDCFEAWLFAPATEKKGGAE